MKFIGGHARTQDLLDEWAGEQPARVAEHYFWIAGSPFQKTHQGLLQHLLHQILRENPTLVPIACVRRWQKRHLAARNWSVEELYRALRSIANCPTERLCFFVDGLDEYSTEDQHRTLALNLVDLCKHSNLKIVVSSRPWPVFVQAFKQCESLRLEDLNRRDIVEYVLARLRVSSTGQVPDDINYQCFSEVEGSSIRSWRHSRYEDLVAAFGAYGLVLAIVDKANGVFLWVSLVLDGICQRLSARQEVSQLLRFVDDFPPQLEEYFRQLVLQRIHKTWLSETAMVLKVMLIMQHERTMQRYPDPLSLQDFWILSKISANHDFQVDFALKTDYATIPAIALSDTAAEAISFLSACCKDLLIVSQSGGEQATGFACYCCVDFLHRTVYDFLMLSDMQSLLDQNVPAYINDGFFLSRLTLARLKMIPFYDRSLNMLSGDPWDVTLPNLVVDSLSISLWPERDGRRDQTHLATMPQSLVEEHGRVALFYLERPELRFEDLDYLTHSLVGVLDALVIKRLNSYVVEILHNRPSLQRAAFSAFAFHAPVLLVALGFDQDGQSKYPHNELSFVRSLLEMGADPNGECKYHVGGHIGFRNTIWSLFLSGLWSGRLETALEGIGGVENIDPVTSTSGGTRLRSVSLWDIVRTLIEFGADLSIPVCTAEGSQSHPNGSIPQGNPHRCKACMDVAVILGTKLPIEKIADLRKLLQTYSAPAKRQELDDARVRRIRRWPTGQLSWHDRKLRQASRYRTGLTLELAEESDSDNEDEYASDITSASTPNEGSSR